MEINNPNRCPACGVAYPDERLPAPVRFHASGECYGQYLKLIAYTLQQDRQSFIHQLAVDTYAAQHSGSKIKPIGLTYALIGLCLVVEHHFSGLQVQKVHKAIPRQGWELLPFPDHKWTMTVCDVLEAKPGQDRDQKIKEWVTAGWNGWEPHHLYIKRIVAAMLDSQKG